jgi:antitoxin HicB
MQSFAYPARFVTDEDGRILVTFRDFPHSATDGADRAEAITEAADLLESVLADYVHHGKNIPSPSAPRRNEIQVSPSAVTAAQLALYTAMRHEKVTPKELAKRLRWPAADVRRLVDLTKNPPLEMIERALAALGHRLTVALDAAE